MLFATLQFCVYTYICLADVLLFLPAFSCMLFVLEDDIVLDPGVVRCGAGVCRIFARPGQSHHSDGPLTTSQSF